MDNDDQEKQAEAFEKVEFPTFLQQQPTIIFGRNARELLILACGGSAAFSLWQTLSGLQASPAGLLCACLLCAIPLLLAAILAFVTIGTRPLEEWAFVLIAYITAPKLYLYLPSSLCNAESEMKNERQERHNWNKQSDLY